MKKIIFIAFILLRVTSAIAQENNNSTLSIIGETDKKIVINNYRITIALKEIVSNGYQQTEPKSLSEVTQLYSDKLKGIGVDFGKFNKNNLYKVYTSSYSEVGDVAYYNYTSSSEEEILKVIKQKSTGLTVIQTEASPKKLTNEEWANLTNAAIQDAKIKGKKIASHLSKKLGKIITIENTDTKTQHIASYRPNEIQKHLVKVVFTLE
ncbi:hypothetical protein [Aquimarina longa]|uniref:hypothetical protein n=1 Tax=Aquimarina longa TaxID=1080221 RepID=UPI0007861C28|nr:hypothetical protein [Aquimarina longa]